MDLVVMVLPSLQYDEDWVIGVSIWIPPMDWFNNSGLLTLLIVWSHVFWR